MPIATIPVKWLQQGDNQLTSRFEVEPSSNSETSGPVGIRTQDLRFRRPAAQSSEIGKTHNDSPQVPFGGAVSFVSWLQSQGKTKSTIRETLNYSKRFASVLDTGDASPLLMLSPRNKQHAMSALANLSKFQGRYDAFLQLRQRYNLKWSKGDSLQSFNRFFDEELSFDTMLQRIRKMIEKTPTWTGQIIKLGVLTGLRPSEVLESVRLLLLINQKNSCYYNPERQALEHFRFPEIFIRQTKKAYISFVTKEMLLDVVPEPDVTPSYYDMRYAFWRRGLSCDMSLCRKVFASHLRQSGIQAEIVDLLQGRVSQSILTRHYLVPKPTFKEDVLQALEKLRVSIS